MAWLCEVTPALKGPDGASLLLRWKAAGSRELSMMLPEHALEQLRRAAERLVEVGEVWWLPEAEARYPGGKDRFCLLVGLESAMGGDLPVRAHYVAGSTGRSSGPTTIKVTAGDAGLRSDTYFRFSWSGSIDLPTLVRQGKWRGRLEKERVAEIKVAIKASKRVVLKRFLT
jgi:mRNA-degrading endonuclease toxin of MazEF toxin-antitoxin module